MIIPVFLAVFTFVIFIFEMYVVRPELTQLQNASFMEHALHVTLSTFCFINVAGNMLMSMMKDNKLRRSLDSGEYCPICLMLRPADSWHCTHCNACILRRDHHCHFLSRCIGLNNHRYYMLYVAYISISMIYALYYNYLFVSSKYEDSSMLISFFRIINPIICFIVWEPMGVKELYMLILIVNLAILFWSSVIFLFHFRNALIGVTAHQSKYCFDGITNWRENLRNIFGTRWYWAVLFPFVDSPIPEYGKLD